MFTFNKVAEAHLDDTHAGKHHAASAVQVRPSGLLTCLRLFALLQGGRQLVARASPTLLPSSLLLNLPGNIFLS